MTRPLWWSHRDNHAVRNGDWKLVKSNDGEWELFQINQDRVETKNLAAQHPGKCKELKKLWEDQVNQFREDRKIK